MKQVPFLRIALILAITIAAVWAASHYHDHPQIGTDDANIFFSYAENISAGHGFVYNIGGERVEGFTSLLWVLLSALAFRCGFHEQSLLVLSVVLLAASQIIFCSIIRRQARNAALTSWPFETAFIALVYSSPAYVSWMSITLMDTCLWGTFFAVAAYYILRPPSHPFSSFAAGAIFCLMPLARPEGILLAPALILLMGINMRAANRPDSAKLIIWNLAGVTAVICACTFFRLAYFGYPFPNTFYAKVSPSILYNLQQGSAYFWNFLKSSSIACLGVMITALWIACAAAVGVKNIIWSNLSQRASVLYSTYTFLAVIILTALFLPVITGGDHFAMFRFYQPAYPALCLIIILTAMHVIQQGLHLRTAEGKKRRIIFAAFCAAPVICWLLTFAHSYTWHSIQWGSPIYHEFTTATDGVARGRHLKRLFAATEKYPSLGVITVGGIKRTYPGPIIDLMGLNNTVMGHSKGIRIGYKNHAAFNVDAFYLLMPDIVLALLPPRGETVNIYTLGMRFIFLEPQFQRAYTYGRLSLTSISGSNSLTAFFRKDFLHSLAPQSGWSFQQDKNWEDNWVHRQPQAPNAL